eukprot:SAG31_NODE_96_length_25743_cov_56.175948_16_plen_185_part_00
MIYAHGQAGLVQTALYIGYFVGAPPAAIVANRTSYKVSILIGLSLYAGGAILFWPAGLVRAYPLFLTALLIIGLGLACLETSVSPYLIRFGPSETAARRINFAAVFNPLGENMRTILFEPLPKNFVGLSSHCTQTDAGGSARIDCRHPVRQTIRFQRERVESLRLPRPSTERFRDMRHFDDETA